MIVKRNFEKEKAEAVDKQKTKKKEKERVTGKSSEEEDSEDDEVLTDEKISQIKEIDNHYLNQKLFSDRDDGSVEVLDDIDLKN
jgi:hypothetical protein